MKKTLLSLITLISLTGFSQVNISFESSETYTLGQLDGQGPSTNEWGLLNSSATNVMDATLATVVNSLAFSGTNSLNFQSDNSEWGFYAGVLSPYFEGFDNEFIITHSFYAEAIGFSDYIFQVFDFDGSSLISVADVRFDYLGNIDFNDGTILNNDLSTYTSGQWYTIQVERTSSDIILRVNGTQIASFPNYGTGTSAKFLGFRFDNYGSGFNIDDISIEVPASSDSFNLNSISLYPNPAKDFLNISNTNNVEIKNISVTDINGRVIKNETGSLTQINVSDLNAGVYFVTIEAAEGKTTKKFIKQ
jgi:hypothetical protein